MKTPAERSTRSSAATPASELSRGAQLRRLAWFALSIVVVAFVLAATAKPWLQLTLWQIFRRCASISAVIVLWIFVHRIHRESFGVLGFGPWKQGRGHLLMGVLIGLSGVALLVSAYLLGDILTVRIDPNRLRVARVVLLGLPAMVLVAFLEEAVFRGYVLQRLMASSRWLAVVGSSAAYALVHVRTYLWTPLSGFELVGLFFLGLILALATLQTRQLYLAIGLHASLAYWARINKLVVEFSTPLPDWLVGTSRMVNGVLVWPAILAIGWVALRLAAAARQRSDPAT